MVCTFTFHHPSSKRSSQSSSTEGDHSTGDGNGRSMSNLAHSVVEGRPSSNSGSQVPSAFRRWSATFQRPLTASSSLATYQLAYASPRRRLTSTSAPASRGAALFEPFLAAAFAFAFASFSAAFSASRASFSACFAAFSARLAAAASSAARFFAAFSSASGPPSPVDTFRDPGGRVPLGLLRFGGAWAPLARMRPSERRRLVSSTSSSAAVASYSASSAAAARASAISRSLRWREHRDSPCRRRTHTDASASGTVRRRARGGTAVADESGPM
mmetsp:Transcript_10731/g.27555  ORF Transcript_10731/g.27555 Transcript_10731/m.27555 type:complete len:272 (-) Transcript_10731:107-922(-)